MNGLFALTFRQMLGGKKIWFLALFLCLPVLLLGAVLFAQGFGGTGDAEEVGYAIFLYVLYPQGLCILAALIYGAALLAGEIEDKTLVYLFSRAQPRWKILLGKYVATSTVLACMTTASMCISFVLAQAPYGLDLWLALVASIFAATFAYTAIFALLGLALPRRAITVGLIYAVLFEFLLSMVPAVINEITVSHYIRSMTQHIAEVPLPREAAPLIGDASALTAGAAVVLIPIGAFLISALVIHKREWPLTEGV